MASNQNIAQSLTSGWWNLDIDKMIIEVLPMDWRTPINVGFLQAIVAPVKQIHYLWMQNRTRNLYKIRHNWMRCYMTAALNDEFDPQERRITIDEPEQFLNKYIYTEAEQKPKFLGTMYLRTASELGGNGFDFTINMHGVSADLYDIRAIVDYYKLDGPRYNVINRFSFSTVQSEL